MKILCRFNRKLDRYELKLRNISGNVFAQGDGIKFGNIWT